MYIYICRRKYSKWECSAGFFPLCGLLSNKTQQTSGTHKSWFFLSPGLLFWGQKCFPFFCHFHEENDRQPCENHVKTIGFWMKYSWVLTPQAARRSDASDILIIFHVRKSETWIQKKWAVDLPAAADKSYKGGLGDLYVCGAWAVELLEHQTGSTRGEIWTRHERRWDMEPRAGWFFWVFLVKSFGPCPNVLFCCYCFFPYIDVE